MFRQLQELRTKHDTHRQHTDDANCNYYQDSRGNFKICFHIKYKCISKIVTWDSIGLQIFCGKRNKNDRLPKDYCAQKGIIMKIEFFNDWKLIGSYIWC
jgi:hypothetical protein